MCSHEFLYNVLLTLDTNGNPNPDHLEKFSQSRWIECMHGVDLSTMLANPGHVVEHCWFAVQIFFPVWGARAVCYVWSNAHSPSCTIAPSLLKNFYPGLNHADEACMNAILTLQQTACFLAAFCNFWLLPGVGAHREARQVGGPGFRHAGKYYRVPGMYGV